MFPFIFYPSKVFQPLLQPRETNFISCDENVMRDCQKVLEHVALLYPQVCYPIVFFTIFLEKKCSGHFFFGSSFNLFSKDDVFIFGLSEVCSDFPDSLIS